MPYLQRMEPQQTLLTVTAKGQVTFRHAVLEHLGAAPGDRLAVDLLPGGRVEVHTVARGSIDGFIGALTQAVTQPVSIEEMGRIAAEGWAGAR